MHVLHIVPSLAVAYGGPGRVAAELAGALAGEGVVADLLATTAATDQSLVVSRGAGASPGRGETLLLPRVGPQGLGLAPRLPQWLVRHARGYDLLHLHGVFSFSTLVASRVASAFHIPYVVAPHGMLEPWGLAQKSWKKGPYLSLVERRTFSRAAAVHALTAAEAAQVRGQGFEAPTFVLPNGIDLEQVARPAAPEPFLAKFSIRPDERVLLFLGRISPKKGLDVLLRAFAPVRTGFEGSVRLVIAGPDEGGYRIVLEEMIRELNLSDSVVFTGELSGSDKLAALAAAYAFILPSRSEGFSVAVVEALAAGCPVVISTACNFDEVEAEGAGIVIPADAEALVEALAWLLGSPANRARMADNARRLARDRFGWPSLARTLADLYRDVVRGAHSSAAWTQGAEHRDRTRLPNHTGMTREAAWEKHVMQAEAP